MTVIEKGTEDEVFAKPPPLQSISMATNSKFEEDLGDESKLMDQYLSNNHESTRISQINSNVGANFPKTNLTLTGLFFFILVIDYINYSTFNQFQTMYNLLFARQLFSQIFN